MVKQMNGWLRDGMGDKAEGWVASLLATACGSYLGSIPDTLQESQMDDICKGVADTNLSYTQNICKKYDSTHVTIL